MAEDLYGQLTGFAAPLDRVPSDIDPVGSRKSRASGGCCKAEKRCFYVERNAADGISDRHDPGNAVCDRTDRFSETDIAAAVSDTEGKCHSCGTLPAASWAWFSCPGHRTGLYRGTAGMGKQLIPVRNLFLGVVVKFALTWSLTAIPAVNIKGAALGNAAAYTIAAVMDVRALRRTTGTRVNMIQTFWKPALCSVIMGLSAAFCYGIVYGWTGHNSIACLGAVTAAVFLYGILILRTGTIQKEEMRRIPAGRKFVSFCEKIKLW